MVILRRHGRMTGKLCIRLGGHGKPTTRYHYYASGPDIVRGAMWANNGERPESARTVVTTRGDRPHEQLCVCDLPLVTDRETEEDPPSTWTYVNRFERRLLAVKMAPSFFKRRDGAGGTGAGGAGAGGACAGGAGGADIGGAGAGGAGYVFKRATLDEHPTGRT